MIKGGNLQINIAHENQTLIDHLLGVADISQRNAKKIDSAGYGELLGLLHDLGKYSSAFQVYIRSAIGLLDPDVDEEAVDAKALKGKIDHSSAGGQFLWQELSNGSPAQRILVEMLCLCLVSHHSGLIDCLASDERGTSDTFTARINKNHEKTHLAEVGLKAEILDRVQKIISSSSLTSSIEMLLKSIFENLPEKNQRSVVFNFQVGLLVRFFFSCLIDADRQDSADSEKKHIAQIRQNGLYLSWSELGDRLESHLARFNSLQSDTPEQKVNLIRANVSRHCFEASKRNQGLYSLTVPTGGGKTLASLRFAIHHAKEHALDRIIYVIPFTSIIDQNADVVRGILEKGDDEKGRVVLEHHSNMGSEKQGWKEKLLCENWDAPVVYTTMVQFLEALFGGGTRGARRMHQLAKSVIVFDEIQTLPIRCVHMFCNAVNFLINSCGSSVVLCTATQPLLGEVEVKKGALNLSSANEIVPDVGGLFSELKRVEVFDQRKPRGWNDDEVVKLAIDEVSNTGSCLIIVNMKRSARNLFMNLHERNAVECFHLSTGMCPVHRKATLKTIRQRLDDKKPIICVSTQLIEAGVDVDFGSVIRFMAGLDSIAQAAGRCNRNGKNDSGRVFVVNPAEENIDCLKDISIGKEKTERVLNDYKEAPEKYGDDPIGPELLSWYYRNYFFGRKEDMDYPVTAKESGRTDTLLNMLSVNAGVTSDYLRANQKAPPNFLRQSFMAAGKLFKAIDAPTQSVIVRFGTEGNELVNDLCAAFDLESQFGLLRKAQQYSVNLFPHEFRKLSEQDALFPVQDETEIFYLDSKFYSDQFGISMEPVNEEEFLHV